MPGRRPTLQRGVIILPSAFTLGNLFFGVYAMVSVSRGDFLWAGWCIIIAGILDMLDGSVARLTRTGSAFGAELDSLVDAVSFGVAPGYIMFALFFADAQWSWVLSFVYITAVVVRLARFNIEQVAKRNGISTASRRRRPGWRWHRSTHSVRRASSPATWLICHGSRSWV